MAKLTLDDVGNLNTAGLATINENSSRIEAALENTLSRDGTSPNQMEADLDLNHNDIINVDNIDAETALVDTLYVNGSQIIPGDNNNINVSDIFNAISIDEDNMASNRDDKLPTQQSVKAYVDNGTIYKVADTTALKAVDTGAHGTAFLEDVQRTVVFDGSDLSAEITAAAGDESLYVAPTSDPTGASGAWVLAADNSYFRDSRPAGYVHNVGDWCRSVRRIEEFSPGVADPSDWGAIFNTAFGASEMPASGGTLELSARVYPVTTEPQLDLSHVTHYYDNTSIDVVGKGSGLTQILSKHTGAAFNIVNGAKGIPKLRMGGFMLFREGGARTGNGLAGDDIAFAQFFNLDIRGFDKAVALTDIISSQFRSCNWSGNNYGGTFAKGDWSPINDILFDGCEISLNYERALNFSDAGGIVFNGGGCQYNGKLGDDTTRGGHVITSVATLGKTTVLSMNDVHVEGNVGTGGDVMITNGTNDVLVRICSKFYRADPANYTDYCIRLNLNNGGNILCEFGGSTFANFNGWTPSSSTPFIKEFGTTGSAIPIGPLPYFDNVTEAWSGKMSSVPWAVCQFNGTTTGSHTPTRANNVATVERLAAGKYRITPKRAPYGSIYSVTGSVNGSAGTACFVDGPRAQNAAYVDVWTVDSSGTATDCSIVSVQLWA